MRRTIGIIIGTALVFIVISSLSPSKAAEEVCDSSGKVANLNFTLKDINGNDVDLSSFKGNVIILDFWATWCPPCRKEIPGYIDLYNRYKAQGFVVIGVSVDESLADLKKFVKQYNVNYQILIGHDREDLIRAFAPISGYPTSFVIGRDGRICSRHTGDRPLEQYERKIKALL